MKVFLPVRDLCASKVRLVVVNAVLLLVAALFVFRVVWLLSVLP